MASGDTLGRYELAEELGSGGMATVYRAVDTELRREVAIKVLFAHLCKKREVMARFQREARSVAALDHPHILRVHDVGGGPGSGAGRGDAPVEVDPPYIVLELVRGTSLREHLEGPAILAEIVACAGAVMCSALSVAHRAGIIHRDIKPANIMVATGGRLVLADFGVARVADEDSSLVTRTGALLGTPAFMSPEQAHGDTLDERSDVYSLGATLYQMATGSMPFGGPAPKMMWAIANGDMVPPLRRNPAMGKPLARIIERMMATDPGERYASAEAARTDLLALVRSAGLGEAEDELTAYFADPVARTAELREHVIAATLSEARAALGRRELPAAMALADRVLGLDADNADALTLVDELGQGARRGRLVRVAAVVGVVALAGGAAFALWPRASNQVVTVLDAGADAVVIAQVTPPDAAMPVARAPADAAPAVRARIDAGTRRPPRRTPDAAVVVLPPDAAPRIARVPDAAPAPARPARLTLRMTPWCNVVIDGQERGRANASKPIEVAPGRHTIVCTQGPGMGEWRQTVTVTAGQELTLTGSVLTPVSVQVGVSGGDGVQVGGTYRKNGSRFELSPDRYRVDVVKGGKTQSGRWITIPRVKGCTLRDRPAIDCYTTEP